MARGGCSVLVLAEAGKTGEGSTAREFLANTGLPEEDIPSSHAEGEERGSFAALRGKFLWLIWTHGGQRISEVKTGRIGGPVDF